MARIKIYISKKKLPFYPPCEVKCELQYGVPTECLPMVTTKWGFQSWSWILDMLHRGPMDLKFSTCFPEVRGFKIWTCFPEVRWFEVWTCFSEVRWIWNLVVLPKGLKVWSLDVLPKGPMDLKFGRA